jgi:uncharacterized membrane protein
LTLLARRLTLALPIVTRPAPASALLAGNDSGKLALVPTAPDVIAPPAMVVTGQRTRETWVRAWGIIALLVAGTAWITSLTSRWDGWTFLWLSAACLGALGLIIDAIGRNAEMENVFPLILTLAGAGLIALCEIVYLKDVFVGYSPRMNTIFKFYFQAWTILSIAAAAALAWIVYHVMERLPEGLANWQPVAWVWRGLWGGGLALLILMGCVYPFGASHAIYLWQTSPSHSLVGLTAGALPQSDINAIAWLNAHVSGSPTIVEANGPQADYSPTFGRVSTFTGLPTILGWNGHEDQWRLNWMRDPAHAVDYSARYGDIQTIYTGNGEQVSALVRHYHVRYIYVGALEEQTYQANLRLDVLTALFPLAYQSEGVMIFEAPDSAAR